MHKITQCALCESNELIQLWNLPNLPLSETFGIYDVDFKNYDQELLYCASCGHVQLLNQLPVSMLYNNEDYHYSTSNSSSTQKRFTSFRGFVNQFISKPIASLIDIGGNDASLLIGFDANKKYLIDPSLKENFKEDKINFVKAFIEDVDLQKMEPEVVLCSHTLEHIAKPSQFLQSLLQNTPKSTRFFIEVPCFTKQVSALRFDAFFHQHYHYFYPETLTRLIESNGGEILSIEYNAYPTCGGSVMVAFQHKNENSKEYVFSSQPFEKIDVVDFFETSLDKFLQLNISISNWIYSKSTVYGYCASLLLPVIFYHIGSASEKIKIIFDDDTSKHGLTYKNIKDIDVCSPSKYLIDDSVGLLITSYENTNKLTGLLEARYPGKLFSIDGINFN